MKKKQHGIVRIIVLCGLLMALGFCGVMAYGMAESEPPVIVCPRSYLLRVRTEDGVETGEYNAYCPVCNDYLLVLPPAEVPTGTAEAEVCAHQYRRAQEPVKEKWGAASWPVMPQGKHVLYQYYLLTCDLCGEQAEGYMPISEASEHVNQLLTDMHVADEQEHMLIYLCTVCGEYSYETRPCQKTESHAPLMCEYELTKYQR